MRRTPVLAAAAAVLTLAACSSSTSKPTVVGTTPPASVASTAIPAPVTTTTTAAGVLTGFGATQAAWDAHHTADTDKTASGVYNPDPALPKTKDGQVNDQYIAVTADSGRIDSYFRIFTARSTTAALDVVKSELPPDAVLSKPVVATGLADSKCLILTATSAAVGKALGGADGSKVGIELQSWDPKVLDQSAIMSAALVTANKGDAPGC